MYRDPSVSSKLNELLSVLNTQRATLSPQMTTPLSALNIEAKRAGFERFYLEGFDQAVDYLIISGLGGDVESQYATAICTARIFGSLRFLQQNTKGWLKLAAAQDHILALMWLGDAESLARARELSTTLASAGDAQGLLNMYTMTQDITWLEQAVATNDHRAEYELAQAYRKHPSLVANAAIREALIEELCQKSADGGHAPAIWDRVFKDPVTVANPLEKQQRLAQLAWMGQLDGLLEYGFALAGMPRDKTRRLRTYGLEKNLPLAYALLKFAYSKTQHTRPVDGLGEAIEDLLHQMTPPQFEAATPLVMDMEAKIPLLFRIREPLRLLGNGR